MIEHHTIRTHVCLALTAGFFVLLGAGTLHAATTTWRVTPTGTSDGTGWYGSASSLTNALASVGAGDDIWIAEGIYTNAAGVAFSNGTANVTLYGGFTNGMATFGERDWDAYPALLDGDGTRRVMEISATGVTLDGLTVTNGYAIDGSGLYRNGAYTITISNCRFVDNRMSTSSGSQGGAMFLAGGSSTAVSNTVFDSNGDDCTGYCGGSRDGQAIYANSETLTIQGCLFTNNTPANIYASRGSEGGAIYHINGSLTVEDSTFVHNKASVVGSTIGEGGGAACVDSASAVFRRCLFRENTAGDYNGNYDQAGGALCIDAGVNAVTVEHCVFDRNVAGRKGASSIVDSYGGAIFMLSGDVTVSNCTLVGNYSSDEGGALHVGGGTMTAVNLISYTNDAVTRGDDLSLSAGSASVSYCRFDGTEVPGNVYDAVGGVTLSNVHTNDPLFADSDGGDFHLKSASGRWNGSMFVTSDPFPHSPCIDAGDPSHPVGDEEADHGSRINQGRWGGTAEASKSPANAPVVENRSATTNYNIAILRGELVDNDAIAGVTIYYGTSPTVTNTDTAAVIAAPQQTGTVFQAQLVGLDYSTTYYYRCYATNAYGEDWANTTSNFVTGAKPPGGPAGVIHVKSDAAGGGTGDTWFNAFTSLADAMDAVNNPNTNEIWVAAATYDDVTVNITEDVNVYGGFDGTETVRTARDPDANETAVSGAAERRCFYITGGTVLLDGLLITNGYSRYQPISADYGSGIYGNGFTSLTLNDCRIERCYTDDATSYGQGMYVNGGSVMLTNTWIGRNGGNDHGHRGMGIYANNTALTVVDCIFTNNGNAFYSMRASGGGAMYVNGGTLGVTNTLFVNNRHGNSGDTSISLGGGAALLAGGVNYSFLNCIFRGNSVLRSTVGLSYGGTFSLQGSTTTGVVENCTIVDSTADKYGGAIWAHDAKMTLKNCILWTNTTTDSGYDIATDNAYVDVSYCNLSGDKDSATYLFQQSGTIQKGDGLQWTDPRFASDYDDVHLKSTAGRWDPTALGGAGDWVIDAESSACIDKGTGTYGNEPAPNGDIRNLGAYGNTWQASKSASTPAPVVTNIGHGVAYNYVTITGELVVVDTTADVSVYYGKTDWVWDGYVQPSPTEQEDGIPFVVSKGDLEYNQTYYYRSYATNASGDSWASNVLSFTTGSEPAGGPDTVIHVKEGAAGSQSGYTWFDACHTLADGLAKVQGTTNEIWVANRMEAPLTPLSIATNVSIYGGFVGTENTRIERSLANETALDGEGARRLIDITAGTVVLDGLTITNGAVTGTGYGLRASGTYNLTMANCFVKRCGRTDGADGAGAYFGGGTVFVTNCTFDSNGNGHSIQGGGVYASGADVTVVDCLFTNNGTYGYAGRGGDGGAIYQSGGTLSVIRTDFIDNDVGTDAGAYGGAVSVAGSASASFTNCVFRGNTCTYEDGRGDGGNGAALAVVVNAGYTVEVVNCTFAYNTGANRGGAVHANSGSTIIKNCILWSNEVSDVAGADATGEEIYARNAGTEVTISFSDLTGTNGNYVVDDGSATITQGSGMITNNPLFASAADFHLQSTAGRYDPSSGWVNDLVDSPAIDAGDDTDSVGAEPAPNGGTINMGAYGGTGEASKTPVPGLSLIFK